MSKSGTDVVIVGAARTPVGAFNGAFASVPAHELGRTAISAAIERAGIDKAEVSEVVMGQILQAGQGQNPARQASVNAGLPVEVPAWGVNQLCGSGLRAVALGYQAIVNGDSEIVVAGGQESMSMAPHAAHLRAGQKMGSLDFVDTMIKDGLWDAFNGYHMGQTAENVAARWQITRDEQDTSPSPRRTRRKRRRRVASSRTKSRPLQSRPAKAKRLSTAMSSSSTVSRSTASRASNRPSRGRAERLPLPMRLASMTALPRWF